jgi:hypothetical protein
VLALQPADRIIAVRADDPAGVLLRFLLVPLRVGVGRDEVERVRLFRDIADRVEDKRRAAARVFPAN